MAPTIKELEEMSREDLIKKHDFHAKNRKPTVEFFRNEIHRRDMKAHSATIRNLTWAIVVMTVIMTAATAVNAGWIGAG